MQPVAILTVKLSIWVTGLEYVKSIPKDEFVTFPCELFDDLLLSLSANSTFISLT